MDITGDGKDNTLTGTTGDDTISGLGGNDTIEGLGGKDTISGGEGADTVILDGVIAAGSSFDGGTGTDTLLLRDLGTKNFLASTVFPDGITTVNAILVTSEFASFERFEFESKADTTVALVARFGYTLAGSKDAPSFQITGPVELVGGDGFDNLVLLSNLSAETAPGGYLLELPAFTYTDWDTPDRPYLPGDRVSITLSGNANGTMVGKSHDGILSLTGGSGNDTLEGSADMDYLSGGAGNNILHGNGGSDALVLTNTSSPGQFPTTLTGAGSLFDGGKGFDWLVLGGVVDFQGTVQNVEGLYLVPEYTNANSTSQYATIASFSGEKFGQLLSDLEIDGVGTIRIKVGDGDSFDGSDLTVAAGAEVSFEFWGGQKDETIVGTVLDDAVSGDAGDDKLTGGAGDDEIVGGFGKDTAYFADALADCKIAYDGDAIIVTTKTEGTDVLYQVEALSFAGVIFEPPQEELPPTVTFDNGGPLYLFSPVTYVFQFSEPVTGLTADDITVAGGSVTSIAGGLNLWFVTITPTSDFEGELGLALKAGAVTDAAGDTNAFTAAPAQIVDTKRPTLISVTPAEGSDDFPAGGKIVLEFSEPVFGYSGLMYLDQVDGTNDEGFSFNNGSNPHVAISGSTVTITPSEPLIGGAEYEFSINLDTFRDVAGNTNLPLEIGFTSAPVTPSRLFAPTGFNGIVGNSTFVVGTDGVQDIVVVDRQGDIEFDASFNTGGDIIRLGKDAADFTVQRVGSRVVFADSDSTYSVPVGSAGTTIMFANAIRELSYDSATAKVTLGTQVVTSTPTVVTVPPVEPPPPFDRDFTVMGRLFVAPDSEIMAGGNLYVVGTEGAERLIFLEGQAVLDPSFNLGGDELVLYQPAKNYTAQRSGSSVILTGVEGTVSIPVSSKGIEIDFYGDDRTLIAVNGVIKIDDQIITSAVTALG